jgi:hypothetical protein
MKKYKIFTVYIFLLLSLDLFSHEIFLNVLDNKDNTITVFGDTSTGEDTAGALIKLESLINAKILFKERLPESSKLIIPIPKEPYQIVLDAGPEEGIFVKGGIAPIEGFNKEFIEKINNNNSKLSKTKEVDENWDLLTIFFFTLCLILFGLAIYFSNKNTNKILNQLK